MPSAECPSKDALRKREWRKENPEKWAAQQQAYRDKTKGARRDYDKAYHAKNKDKRREQGLKRKYGITVSARDALIERQGGVCPICLGVPTDVDHNHSTGAVRGVLCSNCNKALGLLYDNPESLERAVLYLKAEPCSLN
jgi:hypothetical protein